MTTPDAITARNLFLEGQARAGVPDIDTLTAERDKLYRDHAALFARFENNAAFEVVRLKQLRSVALLRIRDEGLSKGERYTEKVLEAMQYADPEVQESLETSLADNCRYVVVAAQIRSINDRVNRGNALLKRYEP